MLLGTRSIVVQILILGITATASSQNYDPELHATNEELDDHSEYTGDENAHAHPDYSKYFALDKSSTNIGALVQGGSESGFVAPIEFSSFFGTPNFAFDASNKQEVLKPIAGAEVKNDKIVNGFVTPEDFRGSFSEYDANGFGAQDYFEQAQKQQKAENEEEGELSPGPSYISHRVPSHASTRTESEDENDYETPTNLKTKNYDAKNKEEDESDNVEQIESYEPPRYTSNFKPSPVASTAPFQPSNPGKGLLSVQELNSLPYVSQVYNNFAPAETKTTPYQKYSFQPAGSNLALKQVIPKEFQSTPAPYNPSYLKNSPKYDYQHQSSESIPQNIKRDCIKVNKQVSNRNSKLVKQPMQCFVCKDPKSGAKYERCSYSNEPTPKSYYTSTSHSHGNPESYRNKRDESESYVNPYDEVKAKSHEYYSQPDEFEKNFYKAPNFDDFSNEGYSYSPKENQKEAEEKSSSEIQSQELLKQKDSCKKSHKNGVTCTVCTNAKTGANYEQCSYESEPNEKKYAYVSEKKFDGEGNPVEEKEEDGDESKSVEAKQEPSSQEDEAENYEENEDETKESAEEEDGAKNSKLSDKEYDIPSHFEEDTFERQKYGVRGLDPKLYGSLKDSPKDDKEERGPQKFEHIDDYHLKLFPQLNNQETRTKESRAQPDNPYFDQDLTAKKDVEKVLEEFSKKDRSNCKQVSKKGMTCYLCVDKHGIQQEECMYVSESKPQSSHVAYHEVQHLKAPEKNNASEAESQVKPVLVKENGKRKTFFKKATTAEPIDAEENPSNYEFKKIPTEKTNEHKSKIKRSTNSKAEPKKSNKNEDPEPQFDINDEGGLYAAETAPVYSKEFGLTLAKYIVEKSPIEIEFDRS